MSSRGAAERERHRAPPRRRADLLALEQELAPSREKARALILAGEVWCGETRVEKPGQLLAAEARLALRSRRPRFVGRGGEKLEGALAALGMEPRGRLVWDIGAATGGFTDCLLRRGAARVVAVDVGRGQLDASLRGDARVEVREGVNARYLRPRDLPGPPDLVVIDVSFISLEKILPAVSAAAPGVEILALVKPQFEAGRGRVGRGGIVRDPSLQEEVLRRVCARSVQWGLSAAAILESPLRGAGGNREFFVRLRAKRAGAPSVDVERAIREAVHGRGQEA